MLVLGESGASFEISRGVTWWDQFFFLCWICGLQGGGSKPLTMRHAEWILEALHWNIFFLPHNEGKTRDAVIFFFVFCAVNIMAGSAPPVHSHYDFFFSLFGSSFHGVFRCARSTHCSPTFTRLERFFIFFCVWSVRLLMLAFSGARALLAFTLLFSKCSPIYTIYIYSNRVYIALLISVSRAFCVPGTGLRPVLKKNI